MTARFRGVSADDQNPPRRYGVFDSERGFAIRGTFIIDKDGVVRWKVVNPTPQARDLTEYSKALAALG